MSTEQPAPRATRASARGAGLWPRVVARVRKRLVGGFYQRRALVAAGAVLLAGLGVWALWGAFIGGSPAELGLQPVEVTAQELQIQGSGVILNLKEKRGERRLSLSLQEVEARVIAREQGLRLTGEHPQAYELLNDLLGQLGGRVDRVLVQDADQAGPAAQILVTSAGEPRLIRARAGDAVALAMRTKAPIFVENELLERSRRRGG